MTADERLQKAAGNWIPRLAELEGWEEWKRQSLADTLWHDDRFPGEKSTSVDYVFPQEIADQHDVITRYYALLSTLTSLQDCQYYFRRYPFAGLPVEKHEHLRYVCEMYFGRFYEFRERMKELFKATAKYADPNTKLMNGKLIKLYDKEFDPEIRERNRVHHHNRFEEISIDNMAMLYMTSIGDDKGHWKRRNGLAYRKASKEWSERCIRRAARMRDFLNFVAALVLLQCQFLRDLSPDDLTETIKALPSAGNMN